MEAGYEDALLLWSQSDIYYVIKEVSSAMSSLKSLRYYVVVVSSMGAAGGATVYPGAVQVLLEWSAHSAILVT